MKYSWINNEELTIAKSTGFTFTTESLQEIERPSISMQNKWQGSIDYKKHTDGFVEYEGTFVAGDSSIGTLIAEFSENFRPIDNNHVTILYEVIANGVLVSHARIGTDGQMRLITPVTSGTTYYFAGAYPTTK